jgi:hypothetical protein
MAKLLKVFAGMHKFKNLIIKYNEVGQKSMDELMAILDRGVARSLEELRLVKC